MGKLILSLDGIVLKETSITKERTTIGRRAHNDLVIDNLVVSGEHAAIVTIMNDAFLEDMNSTNGTLVNGQPIKKHFLQNNDLIEVGKYKIKYIAESRTQTGIFDSASRASAALTNSGRFKVTPPILGNNDSYQATQKIEPGSNMLRSGSHLAYSNTSTQTVAPSIFGNTVSGAPISNGPRAIIRVLNGKNFGKELEFNKALTTIGRPGVQVAVITKRPQGFYITHVEGINTPVVNNQPIGADPVKLNDHDIIELSGTQMEFSYKV